MSPITTEQLATLAPTENASLTEVQEWMARLLRHKEKLPQSEALQAAAALHFTGNDRLSPAEQVDIYRQQFWLRHTGSLVEDFPGLTGLLGQEAWEPIVESYLIERGYDIFALKNLGQNMAAHLQACQEDSLGTDLPKQLLVEMARVEWSYASAFDVRDDAPLSAEKLEAIPPDAWAGARFVLSDSVSLHRLDYPVADLRRQLKKDRTQVDLQAIEKSPVNLVVYRRDRTLWDKKVSSAAFLLLEQFRAGTPLVAACEAVVAQEASSEKVLEAELTSWFTLWGRLGWIVDVEV